MHCQSSYGLYSCRATTVECPSRHACLHARDLKVRGHSRCFAYVRGAVFKSAGGEAGFGGGRLERGGSCMSFDRGVCKSLLGNRRVELSRGEIFSSLTTQLGPLRSMQAGLASRGLWPRSVESAANATTGIHKVMNNPHVRFINILSLCRRSNLDHNVVIRYIP
jgi:hypothetical protein